MDIIAKSAPEINMGELNQSLRDFRNYMVETLELIDFTLSNQKNRISGAVSEDNFKQLENAVATLSTQVAGISANVASLSANINELQTSVTQLITDVAAINVTLQDHEARIAALE